MIRALDGRWMLKPIGIVALAAWFCLGGAHAADQCQDRPENGCGRGPEFDPSVPPGSRFACSWKPDSNGAAGACQIDNFPASLPAFSKKIIRRGDTGGDVVTLQQMLALKGIEVRRDGIYGSETKAGVKQLQKKAGLKIDGIAGPDVLKQLKR